MHPSISLLEAKLTLETGVRRAVGPMGVLMSPGLAGKRQGWDLVPKTCTVLCTYTELHPTALIHNRSGYHTTLGSAHAAKTAAARPHV